MLSVRRRPRLWNLPACLRVDLLRTRIFSRSLDEVTLTITCEIVPMHAKPAVFTAVCWRQGSTPRKYAAHNTYSSIFLVHTLQQTELTKEGRSRWRLWPLRPAVSCTRDGADWPKGCNRWTPTANQWFFWLYSNARHAVNKRRTSPGSWSQELSNDTKLNEIHQRRPKWCQFKKSGQSYWFAPYFQDTGVLIFGGVYFWGIAADGKFQGKMKGYLFSEGYLFTKFYGTVSSTVSKEASENWYQFFSDAPFFVKSSVSENTVSSTVSKEASEFGINFSVMLHYELRKE